jgi:hypothetical protein
MTKSSSFSMRSNPEMIRSASEFSPLLRSRGSKTDLSNLAPSERLLRRGSSGDSNYGLRLSDTVPEEDEEEGDILVTQELLQKEEEKHDRFMKRLSAGMVVDFMPPPAPTEGLANQLARSFPPSFALSLLPPLPALSPRPCSRSALTSCSHSGRSVVTTSLAWTIWRKGA